MPDLGGSGSYLQGHGWVMKLHQDVHAEAAYSLGCTLSFSKKEEMDRSSSTLKSQNAESVQRQIIIHLPPLLPKRIRNKNKAFSTSIK